MELFKLVILYFITILLFYVSMYETQSKVFELPLKVGIVGLSSATEEANGNHITLTRLIIG